MRRPWLSSGIALEGLPLWRSPTNYLRARRRSLSGTERYGTLGRPIGKNGSQNRLRGNRRSRNWGETMEKCASKCWMIYGRTIFQRASLDYPSQSSSFIPLMMKPLAMSTPCEIFSCVMQRSHPNHTSPGASWYRFPKPIISWFAIKPISST